MRYQRLPLVGLGKVIPERLGDDRGYFSEVYKADWFRAHVSDVEFVQENESRSAKAGTIRGLHFQLAPHAQGKLVRCLSGRIFDVAVDIREGSPTYGKWYGTELSMQNGEQLWIPSGFAHGFATLEPDCVVAYKVTSPYNASSDRGLLWSDVDIGIEWPLPLSGVTLSEKDKLQPKLASLPTAFQFTL